MYFESVICFDSEILIMIDESADFLIYKTVCFTNYFN